MSSAHRDRQRSNADPDVQESDIRVGQGVGEPFELRRQDVADDLREDRRVLAQALEELDVRVRPARRPRRIREQVDPTGGTAP